MSKFKIGDKVVKSNGSLWHNNDKFRVISGFAYDDKIRVYGVLGIFNECDLELYSEENKGESKINKTFKGWEIAKMLYEGELKDSDVITSGNSKYYVGCGCLWDSSKNGLEIGNSFLASKTREWIVGRKEYSFEEAFKKYRNSNVEIESCVTGKKINGYSLYDDINFSITLKEIENSWYVNN